MTKNKVIEWYYAFVFCVYIAGLVLVVCDLQPVLYVVALAVVAVTIWVSDSLQPEKNDTS